MPASTPVFSGKTIAIPETRQLDVLAKLFEARGANTWRCPLVSIHDAPDPAPVRAWIERGIEGTFDLTIFFTGEGVRRLLGVAERSGVRDSWLNAMGQTPALCRGPKPERELRRLGVPIIHRAAAPTTDGVIATLDQLELHGQRVAVQLYGTDPNARLMSYLAARHAVVDPVAPYVYASESDEAAVLALIDGLVAGQVDAVVFTSQPQYQRLRHVAEKHDREADLVQGLANTKVAAVGPVIGDLLRSSGVRVDCAPEDRFFMKPMVTAMSQLWSDSEA
ncbi:MAG: uroporphyrinogen-III synthase [Pseudomonadota bacterium]|nr:uroporphyrinogen-III synthase [Pseudomonadota bacterium]